MRVVTLIDVIIAGLFLLGCTNPNLAASAQAPDVRTCARGGDLSESVSLAIAPARNSADDGQEVLFTLVVANHSPCTIAAATVSGLGADLIWPGPSDLPPLAPGTSVTKTMSATVSGPAAQPIVSVAYRWTDGEGGANTGVLLASGERLLINPGFLRRLPDELIAALLGVVTGAAAVLIPNWVTSRRERNTREQANRERAQGILHLASVQCEQTAGSTEPIDSALLDSIYREGELYRAVSKRASLLVAIQQLRYEIELYNRTTSTGGGAAHTTAVVSAARQLREQLAYLAGNTPGSGNSSSSKTNE
jgi:hypothetical protein